MINLLDQDHWRALRDRHTWVDNPFADRDFRRDVKRKQLTKTISWFTVMLLIIGVPAVYGLGHLLEIRRSLPWFLGGDPLLALFILVSGIHVWFIGTTSQRGTLLMLGQEASRNTLMHLLTLPVSGFQLLLETAVYPWVAAMRVALLLLPFYVFVAAMERISWLDLFFLYVVFGMCSISFPILRRPARGDALPTLPGAMPNQQTAGAAALASTNNRQAQAGNPTAGIWIVLIFVLPMVAIMGAFASGRGLHGVFDILHPYLPDSLIQLMPASMLSWPLLAARGMIYPLNWFGIGVPPVIFALPLLLIQRYLLLVKTSEYLEVGLYRDLAILPTYRSRRRVESIMRSAILVIMTGYLWKWAIWNDGIHFVAGTNPISAPGLPSLVYAILFVSALAILTRVSLVASWQTMEHRKRVRYANRRFTIRSAAIYLITPMLVSIAFYLICCTLSRTAPLPAAVTAIAGPMILLTAIGVTLCYGCDMLLGGFAIIPRIVIPVFAVVGYNSYQIEAAHRLGFLSPTLGLFAVLHPKLQGIGNFYAGLAWQQWVLPGLLVGVACTVLGSARVCGLRRKAEPQEENFGIPEFDPTVYGIEVFMDETAAAMDPKQKMDTPFVLSLVKVVQRTSDNAIASQEIRSRLRGKLDVDSLRNLLILAIIVSVALYQGIPQLATMMGDPLAVLLYGNIANAAIRLVADIQCCWLIVFLLLSICTGFSSLRSFSVERDKSTLGFLLMTPMSATQILNGKALGILISTGTWAMCLGVWTLFLALVVTSVAGLHVLASWAAFIGVCLLIYVAIGIFSLSVGVYLSRITINPGCWSFGGIAAVQVIINGGRFIGPWIASLLNDFGITSEQLGYYCIVGGLIVGILFYLVGVRGIKGLRKRDLSFSSAKRDN